MNQQTREGFHVNNLTCVRSLAGYWHAYTAPNEEPMPLADTPCFYTDIILAFAVPTGSGGVTMLGRAPSKTEVLEQIGAGRAVTLSLGGADVSFDLSSKSKQERFADELLALIDSLGVCGLDVDVEAGLEDPRSVEELGDALECVLSRLPARFLLTFAPETAGLVGAISRTGGLWGNYIPLINRFRERLSTVQMQYYNSGAMMGIDGKVYAPGTPAFVSAMTEALACGFEIAKTREWFCGLPQEKLRIGLPSSPRVAANGYLPPEAVSEAMCMLWTGRRNDIQRTPLRRVCGLMTWSVNDDYRTCCSFSSNARRCCR